MNAATFLALSWIFLFLLVLCSAASGDQKNITTKSGHDVTLPCRAPNNNIIVVEWSRADLDEYVLLYRDEGSVLEEQHPSFKNRVDLQDRQMKDGNVSLILKNVTINDTGTYECRVVQGGPSPKKRVINNKPICIIYLSVDPPGQTGGGTEDGSVGLIVGLSTEIDVEPYRSVELECQGPENGKLILLAWKRPDLLSDGYVFFYRDDLPHKNFQDPIFKDRVKPRDPQMKNMDMSIILSNTTINDTGTYECCIVVEDTGDSRQETSEIKHEIRLKVRLLGPTERFGDGGKRLDSVSDRMDC
ncbi:unnamed protein product [Oreochromis niloticus]|nr:unnamed protein product [Mustela putorius furo]